MNDPDFHFNDKTKEVRHGGLKIALCRLHADMFACLMLASEESPAGPTVVARATGMPVHNVAGEMRHLARRLMLVSIRIGSQPRGRWLIFEEIAKWQPNISPPVRLEGEAP